MSLREFGRSILRRLSTSYATTDEDTSIATVTESKSEPFEANALSESQFRECIHHFFRTSFQSQQKQENTSLSPSPRLNYTRQQQISTDLENFIVHWACYILVSSECRQLYQNSLSDANIKDYGLQKTILHLYTSLQQYRINKSEIYSLLVEFVFENRKMSCKQNGIFLVGMYRRRLDIFDAHSYENIVTMDFLSRYKGEWCNRSLVECIRFFLSDCDFAMVNSSKYIDSLIRCFAKIIIKYNQSISQLTMNDTNSDGSDRPLINISTITSICYSALMLNANFHINHPGMDNMDRDTYIARMCESFNVDAQHCPPALITIFGDLYDDIQLKPIVLVSAGF